MKFSLHERNVSAAYLKKADEIMIPYRDRRAIPDYAKKYPDAQLVLEVTPDVQVEINELKDYYILSKEKLTLCLPDIREEVIKEIKEANIPFFWGYTITTFWELKAAIKTGVEQVRIGAPLFFQCDKLNKFAITKRVFANIAHEGYLSNIDGISGSWIRPEDVDAYEEVFDIIEFADCSDSKEEALYRIYAEQKEWPGRVDMIISNLDTPAMNRMIPEEFVKVRKNCGQRCANAGIDCHICHRLLFMADPELLGEYLNSMDKLKEEN